MGKRGVKVAVGLSGGVDSSVTAALLKEKGCEVTGITMEIYDGSVKIERAEKHACYGPDEKEDVASAEAVCRDLEIPFHVIDLKKEFKDHVIEYFRREYLAGITPNPCIVCNQRIKFGFLLEKAREAGVDFDFFATGHYARIEESGGRFLLKRGIDDSKDQSYFLYALTPLQLSRTLFPLGEYTKQQVREIASSIGLDTADNPESQDFIAGNDYSPLFNKEEVEEGNIIDESGNVLGIHRGIIHYTIGQRKGLGIAAKEPFYVLRIDAEKNNIVVGGKESLFSKGLIMRDLNLIAVDKIDKPYDVKVKIRLNHMATDARVFPQDDNRAEIVFREPQISVTPGQSAVLYSDDTVLGGGIIEKALD